MKKPWEDGFDLEFLSDIKKWGFDFHGRQRLCVKTVVPKGKYRDLAASRFGVIYADIPLTVWETKKPGQEKATWDKEEFSSLEDLVKVWMVD